MTIGSLMTTSTMSYACFCGRLRHLAAASADKPAGPLTRWPAMNNPHGQTVLEDAQTYVARGWKVVPTPERTKDPVLLDWPNLDLSLEDLPTHFAVNGHRPNLGVILGKRSRGIVDVDNDTAEAIALAKLWLPATDAVFGRKSKRRSHYLYYAADGVGPKTTQFKRPGNPREKTGPAMLVELRSNGGQTIFPGSIHESGEPVEWERDGNPATIDGAELERAVRWIAAGSLLVPFWGEGRRNYLALALAGALLRAEWTVEDAGDFIEGVAQVAGDPEWSKRRRQCVESTAAKLTDGANVVGVPALADQIGDQAVVKALVSWLRLGRPAVPYKAINDSADAADASPSPGKPEIDAGIQALPIVTTATWDALKAANNPPYLFQHAETISRLERSEGGQLGVATLDEHGLRHEAARAANWYQVKKDRDTGLFSRKDARPPLDVMRDLLATPAEKRPLPVLTRIVQAPIYAPKGDLLTEPGYHPSARVYYDPPPGLTLPSISPRPTPSEVAAARSLLLDDLMGDFPFVGPAERAHAVALLLLPFVRDMIPGNTPLHLIDGPSPGTGKGLLASVLLAPALGASVQLMSPANDDDEWRKRITSALAGAPGAILIDNIARVFASPDLAAALTTLEWADRLLGQSRIVRFPVRCVWVATGNNITLSTEIARRSVRIRLNPQQDQPWERQGLCFRHPDLHAWVTHSRGALVGAALTLVNAWLAAGRPAGKKTIGSYEEWSRLMGGILTVAGIPDFLANTHEFYEAADTEAAVQRRLVAAWWAAFEEAEVGTAELFPVAETVEGLSFGRSTSERGQRTALGSYVAKMKDRVYGDYRVVKGSSLQNRQLWRLRRSGGAPTPPEEGHHAAENHPNDEGGAVNLVNLVNLSVPNPRGRAGAHTHARTQDECEKVNEVNEVNTKEVVGGAGKESLRPCPGCGTPTLHGWTCRGCRTGCPSTAPATTEPAGPSPVVTTVTCGPSYPELPVRTLTTVDDVQRALPALLAASMVGFDTETTGLDPLTDRLRLVQLATHDGAYVLDARRVDPRVLAPLFDAPAGAGPLMVAQNAAFDLRFLHQVGLATPAAGRLFDTELVARLLSASAFKKGYAPVKHGLAAIAQRVLGLSLDKTAQTSDWEGELTEEQLRYAALDAVVLPLIAERLQTELVAAGLERVAALEMGALPVVAWLMETGVPFDSDGWQRLALLAEQDVARVEQDLTVRAATGGLFANGQSTVKWSSPQQVATLLRERGHAAVTSTEEAVLRQLADEGEPLALLLLRHREASKRASTYGLDYLKHVHPLTGRIHASFRQLGSEAGRMSATDPNVQQVPRDKAYRACVRPGPGRVLVKADFAQIELRLAAQIAPDERLVEAFQRGDDLHTVTARRVLGKTDVTKADRQAAKAVNFGLLYGMGAKGLRQYAADEYGVQWTEEEAQTVRGRFFAEYRGLHAWHRSQPDGEVETRTIAGRRRLGVERYTEKLNSPVQGSGADGLKAALGRLWETRHRVPSAAPILVVHDEIVVECDRDQAEEARAWVMDAMRSGMETVLHRVPAEVEATVCGDWSGIALDGGAP